MAAKYESHQEPPRLPGYNKLYLAMEEWVSG